MGFVGILAALEVCDGEQVFPFPVHSAGGNHCPIPNLTGHQPFGGSHSQRKGAGKGPRGGGVIRVLRQ